MPLLAGIVAAWIAAAPALAPGTEAGGADAARVRAQAARILSSREYQTELPGELVPPKIDLELPFLAKVLRVLAYGGAAALVVVTGVGLARLLRGRPAADVEVAAAGPTLAPVAIPIASAEALAAAGRYGAAIHALLLETLAALSRAARLAPSLTSREIVERVPLPRPARDALAGLVVAVEISHFGGADPGEDDYRACLDRFHAFLAHHRGRA